jgi:uncharacterized protein (TIGR02246 family)
VTKDESAIRAVVAKWLKATEEGDTNAVLDLMTEDALFLSPGRPPMDRAAFRAASEAQSAAAMSVNGKSEINEIQVSGDLAYIWTHLAVTVRAGNAAPITRAGHTLTIFRKIGDRWLLSRDANMLVKSA